jgi:hypothetical protein
MHHIVEADQPRRHPFGIELDLELAQIAAESFHGGDTGNGEQSVVDLELGEVSERHEVRRTRVGLEREFEDFVQSPCEARNQRWISASR